MANKLKKLQLNRVDLVDKPSNPLARVVLFKREDILKSLFGAQTTDGVIDTRMFWEAYYKVMDAFQSSVSSILYDSELDDKKRITMLKTSIDQAADHLHTIFDAYPVSKTEPDPESEEHEIYEKVEKTVDVLNELDTLLDSGAISVEDVEDILEDLAMEKKQDQTQEVETLKTALTAKDAEISKAAEAITTLKAEIETLKTQLAETVEKKAASEPEDIWKGVNPKVREQFEAMQKAQKEAQEKVEKAQEDAATIKMTKRVGDDLGGIAGTVDEKTALLRKFEKLAGAEDFEKLFTMLKAAAEVVKASELLNEKGRTGSESSGGSGALTKIKAKAAELLSKNEAKNEAEAFEKAVKQNPELYSEYMQEGVN